VDTSSMHTLKNCDKVKKGYRKLLEWLDQKTFVFEIRGPFSMFGGRCQGEREIQKS
jgi:hypothetical protein